MMENYIDYLKEGSGIHIKKKNRGKFTDYCGGKVTSECIARGKRSPSATIRKRATFAANARKWHHEDGGIIKAQQGTYIPFIGLRRSINPIVDTEKEYEAAAKQILKNGAVSIPEIEPIREVQETTISEKPKTSNWTDPYRITTSTVIQEEPKSEELTSVNKPDMSKPRSVRNNNPLNIRFTNIGWQGKITDGKTDNEFEEFESRDLGWRAAYLNIKTKMDRGLNTLSKLISSWAPPTENNTTKYIQDVSRITGIDPDAVITQADLPRIGAAMAAKESGNAIDWDDALRGFKFYLGQPV